jgi:uncharacterized repeat protein (TIGR04002 family)
MICVATAYLPRIPTLNGYVHLGDTLVFLCGSLLSPVYAFIAAALGGCLADLLTGYPVWAVASLLIKGFSALCFSARRPRTLCLRNLLAILPAGLLCVGGYYIWAALFISGNWTAPLAELLPNLMQTVVSGTLYAILALALDHVPVLKGMLKNDKK